MEMILKGSHRIGLHSRLYLGILNEYQQLQSFSGFDNIFNNIGIFGIYASTSSFVFKLQRLLLPGSLSL